MFSRIAILIISSCFIASCSKSIQIQQTKEITDKLISGAYFNLPQKSFKIDVLVEKQTYIKGPLSDYTDKYFGNVPYIKDDRVVFSIKKIEVSETIEPDMSREYLLPRKKLGKTSIQNSELGIIQGFNKDKEIFLNKEKSTGQEQTFNFENKEISVPIQLKFVEKSETVIESQITPDSTLIERAFVKRVIVEKSKEELAKETAGLIHKFREERHLLVTAPEDRILDGNAYKFLLEKMKKYEDDYIQLFLGYQQKEILKYQFSFTPSSSEIEKVLFRFGNREGLIPANSLQGKAVTFSINGYNSEYKTEKTGKGIPFIKPGKYNIRVSWDEETLYSENTDIPQLNEIRFFELKNNGKTQVRYDFSTGNIISIIKK